MKNLVLTSLVMLSVSFSALAGEIISSEKGEEMAVLGRVIDVTRTYSKTAGLDAKVVELLGGDGANATRMVLVLNTGYDDTKIFELGIMMYEVKRITFLSKDQIVINFTQDDLDPNDDSKMIIVNRSVIIKFKKNADGTLVDTVETETVTK